MKLPQRWQITCKRKHGPPYPPADLAILSSVGAITLSLPAMGGSGGDAEGGVNARLDKLEEELQQFSRAIRVVNGKVGIGLPASKQPQSDLHVSYAYGQSPTYIQVPFVTGSPPRAEDCKDFEQAGRVLVWSGDGRVGLFLCTAEPDAKGGYTGASKWQLLETKQR